MRLKIDPKLPVDPGQLFDGSLLHLSFYQNLFATAVGSISLRLIVFLEKIANIKNISTRIR